MEVDKKNISKKFDRLDRLEEFLMKGLFGLLIGMVLVNVALSVLLIYTVFSKMFSS